MRDENATDDAERLPNPSLQIPMAEQNLRIVELSYDSIERSVARFELIAVRKVHSVSRWRRFRINMTWISGK